MNPFPWRSWIKRGFPAAQVFLRRFFCANYAMLPELV